MAKSKRATKSQDKPSEFAILALRAMRKAQKTAEKENARYGMKLIVTKRSKPRRIKTGS